MFNIKSLANGRSNFIVRGSTEIQADHPCASEREKPFPYRNISYLFAVDRYDCLLGILEVSSSTSYILFIPKSIQNGEQDTVENIWWDSIKVFEDTK